MSIIVLTKWGNFVGIRIPDEGWLEAFNRVAEAKHDKMLVENLENDFVKNE